MKEGIAPRRLEDITLDLLWLEYRDVMIPKDLDPDNFVLARCHDAWMGGAMAALVMWHGLEIRADISAERRLELAARLMSEGQRWLAQLGLPETFKTSGLQ